MQIEGTQSSLSDLLLFDVVTDYEDQEQDQREQDADGWAHDTLASLDRELEFRSKYPKPFDGSHEQAAGDRAAV